MSYHILQQFDDPCLGETVYARPEKTNRLFNPPGRREREKKAGLGFLLLGRRVFWLLTLSALMVAAVALFFAIEARRRADILNDRLTALERQYKG